ncbi:hypothetical protein E2C01_051277 [Portunus trituberculatus]|uniref:Uncharacterized protein n=1 Tax=Portunus trituberculatus TaxID=210409 RepID=A0A5B7GIG6_PORTR|nr:hypothetical protein [Portunus trituberculatus]
MEVKNDDSNLENELEESWRIIIAREITAIENKAVAIATAGGGSLGVSSTASTTGVTQHTPQNVIIVSNVREGLAVRSPCNVLVVLDIGYMELSVSVKTH